MLPSSGQALNDELFGVEESERPALASSRHEPSTARCPGAATVVHRADVRCIDRSSRTELKSLAFTP